DLKGNETKTFLPESLSLPLGRPRHSRRTKRPTGRSAASGGVDRLALRLQTRRGPQLLALGLQLAAGGQDVAPARRADGRSVAGLVQDGGEGLDRLPVRALIVGAGPGVERDQVHL